MNEKHCSALDPYRDTLDVLIIGGGLSGIGAGIMIQRKFPAYSMAIVEKRARVGGTWDLFTYPGVRSDSSMITLGYSFFPWSHPKTLASATEIQEYIAQAAQSYGIDDFILCEHTVLSISWNSSQGLWTVAVSYSQRVEYIRSRFIILAAGYYDYENPYTPEYPGIEEFKGEFIHPQLWGKHDVTQWDKKNIIVIGSGATAITLAPEIAQRLPSDSTVTMLQRSPTYISSVSSFRRMVPDKIKHLFSADSIFVISRLRSIVQSSVLYYLSRRYPKQMKHKMLEMMKNKLPSGYDPQNYTPRYNPWDERVCACKDDDYFVAIRQGKLRVVTDTITSFTREGIALSSGQELPADIVISATGLNLRFGGGIPILIDGEEISPSQKVSYKGCMLSDVPNLMYIFGSVNSSWTLRVEMIMKFYLRMMSFMHKHHQSIVVARQPAVLVKYASSARFTPGYFKRGAKKFPRVIGNKNWHSSHYLLKEYFSFLCTPLRFSGLTFHRKNYQEVL